MKNQQKRLHYINYGVLYIPRLSTVVDLVDNHGYHTESFYGFLRKMKSQQFTNSLL